MPYKASSFKLLTETIDKFRNSPNLERATDYLKNNAKTYLDAKVAVARGSERKLFEQSHNLVVSFIEGVGSGDVGVKDLKTLAADLRNAEKAHEEREFRMKERKKPEEAGSMDGWKFQTGPGGTGSDLHNYNPSGMKFDPGIGMEEVYDKYAKYRSTMKKESKQSFVAQRMPIVVLSNGIPDLAKLKRTGICDDLLFGYPILKNQVLVGFNMSFLKEWIPNWSKYKKEIENNLPITQALNVDWEGVMEFMVPELKRKTGKSYVMLGKSHLHGKLMWVWMAESSELRRLNGTTGSQTFSVTDWALPFEEEMRGMRPNRSQR